MRLKIGKGIRESQLLEFPLTYRAQIVIKIAAKIAQNAKHAEIDEHDLFLAILTEQESMPIRVLQALKLDIKALVATAEEYANNNTAVPELPFRIEFSLNYPPADRPVLSPYIRQILKRMFHGYIRVRIEFPLYGGHTSAKLFVVTPIAIDTRADATVVVKIDHADSIEDEAQRYQNYIQNSLPAMAAHLMDKPVPSDDGEYAGLKYTFIVGPDETPQNLKAVAHVWSPVELGVWVREQLYRIFGRTWWMQTRSYRFEAWREYDWLLPPILVLDYVEDNQVPPDAFMLRFPVRRGRLATIRAGDIVTVENFTIHKIDRQNRILTLTLGNGAHVEKAYRVRVRNVDFEKHTFYRGEVVEAISGRVWETRHDLLMGSVRELLPDFNVNEDYIPATIDRQRKVINPLKRYNEVLEWQINGMHSRTHGDMHLGNIMIGPGKSPVLIDFANSREGHTAFDWACLEISLLCEVVMPASGTEWDDARRVIEYLMQVNAGYMPTGDSPLIRALAPIIEIRAVMKDILTRGTGTTPNWTEYYVSLMMSALRAVTWDHSMSIPSRRLMLLVAGLSLHELRGAYGSFGTDTPSPDETMDANTNSQTSVSGS